LKNKSDSTAPIPRHLRVFGRAIPPRRQTLAGQLRRPIDRLISESVDAISPLGSSGEFPATECGDHQRVLEAATTAAAADPVTADMARSRD